jgi:hypothetical protein
MHHEQRRGLRFEFSADAEIALQTTPTAYLPAQVKELSFLGCFVETTALKRDQLPVLLKIYNSGEFFEAEAKVLYIKPTGIGLVFSEVKPHFRAVLQGWILAALDKKSEVSNSRA